MSIVLANQLDVERACWPCSFHLPASLIFFLALHAHVKFSPPRVCGDLGVELGTAKDNLVLLDQLKFLYKSKARKAKPDVSKRAHIVIYPDLPSEEMIRECYDADDLPLQRATRSSGTLDCLRKSSKKSRPERALIPMPAPATQSPTMPACGGVPSAMQNPMAQQAMAFMGMDPMAQMNMMQMMAMRFLAQNQHQETSPTGLRIFAGNKAELNQVTPNRSPSAPSSAASPPAVVTPQADSQDDSQSQEVQLALPDVAKLVTPDQQAVSVQAATQARQETRAKAKETEQAPKTPSAKAKAKSKASAKAKANAKGAAKSLAQGSAKSKASLAAASSKRKAGDGDHDAAPAPKATAKMSAKAKAKAERTVFTQENPPPVPEPKSGTTWYRKGKIHRNSGAFRIFLNSSDRCDRKVKIADEDNCEAEWQKAIKMIDDSYDDVQDAD